MTQSCACVAADTFRTFHDPPFLGIHKEGQALEVASQFSPLSMQAGGGGRAGWQLRHAPKKKFLVYVACLVWIMRYRNWVYLLELYSVPSTGALRSVFMMKFWKY